MNSDVQEKIIIITAIPICHETFDALAELCTLRYV